MERTLDSWYQKEEKDNDKAPVVFILIFRQHTHKKFQRAILVTRKTAVRGLKSMTHCMICGNALLVLLSHVSEESSIDVAHLHGQSLVSQRFGE